MTKYEYVAINYTIILLLVFYRCFKLIQMPNLLGFYSQFTQLFHQVVPVK